MMMDERPDTTPDDDGDPSEVKSKEGARSPGGTQRTGSGDTRRSVDGSGDTR